MRPSINLKSGVKIVSGIGTGNDPYRLERDNDTNLSGTKLNTRYSGEYIHFGIGENNLYRIVSHETEGLTKITSAIPLKNNESYITSSFGSNTTFSSENTIGLFLNGNYLTNYVGNDYTNMLEENTTWYLGTVTSGASYKLAKYTDITGTILTLNNTSSKVGMLRIGELMSGQFDISKNNTDYWTLNPIALDTINYNTHDGSTYVSTLSNTRGIKPAMNLKSNVIITSGDGTKENPFEIVLSE